MADGPAEGVDFIVEVQVMLEKLEDVISDVAPLLELVKSGVLAGVVSETGVVCDDVGGREAERVSEVVRPDDTSICDG